MEVFVSRILKSFGRGRNLRGELASSCREKLWLARHRKPA